MVMMAFTNSKSLAGIVKKGSPVSSPSKGKAIGEQQVLFSQVLALINKGRSNEYIMSKLKLRKMELAGYKAARTRQIRGNARNMKKGLN